MKQYAYIKQIIFVLLLIAPMVAWAEDGAVSEKKPTIDTSTTSQLPASHQQDAQPQLLPLRFYFGLGINRISFDGQARRTRVDTNIINYNTEPVSLVDFRVGLIGDYKALANDKGTIYYDGFLSYATKTQTLSSATCSTTTNNATPCNVDLETTLISLGVIGGWRKDITSDVSFHVGVGGASTYFSQELNLTASGFRDRAIFDANATRFSPIVTVALSYRPILVHVMSMPRIGDDSTVSTGSSSALTISYIFEAL